MRIAPVVVALVASLGIGGYLAQARDKDDATNQGRLAKALTGYVAGAPTSCLPPGNLTLSTTVYGKTILYRPSGGGTVYRNDTDGGCEAAASGDILVTVQHQGRACSGDILRTVQPTNRIPTGSCALRDFVPYKKAA